MRRISSKATWSHKRLFPTIWFGIVASVMIAAVLTAIMNNAWFGVAIALAFGGVMIGMGFLVMKMLVFDLVDEVWDDGDQLVVRNGKQEERIAFANIMNVSYMPYRPDRITLTLREPCRFGNEITFSPAAHSVLFNPFAKNPLVQELIERVDAARRGVQVPESPWVQSRW